jgi:hypothetical protein
MKQLKIEELNQIFQDAETCDSELFAEQRSNILLVTGDHYTKKSNKYWANIRDARDLNQEQKIRLTKNHIQRVNKIYKNNLIQNAPGVVIAPKNDKELQDQKAAQLNQAVWEDFKERKNWKARLRDWVDDYVDIGEVAVKIFWNPNAGKFMGWKPAVNPDGSPQVDEAGEFMKSDTPVFSGDLEIERIWGFNLLRDPSAKSEEENKLWIIRKMVKEEHLKALIPEGDPRRKFIEATRDETYVVFDGNKRGYSMNQKDQVLIREYYWKPSEEYPMGYFAICTKAGILFEGELPFGVYPIIYTGFDSMQTSPRHQSIVKVARPFQAEINRTASKIAETQCASDDKLLVQSGTKITNGGQLPGVRYLQYTGMQPGILPGNSGEQYLPYLQSQIQELYDAVNIDLENAEKAQTDPFARLFQSMRDKKKYSIYAEDLEDFLKEICKTSLRLLKEYLPEDALIPAIGKAEYVNIPEFKSADDICYQIKVQAMGDDIETMMGRTLTINHALQYVGNQLDKKDIGKMIRAMPFGNLEEAFGDLTIDYDSANNMILALDRGEQVQPSPYDDTQYMIRRLVGRMRMADFRFLPPQVQQGYEMAKQQYEEMETQRLQELQRAQSGFIPSGGTKVKADLYIDKGGKVERATFPAESLDWLIKKLAEQGSSQEQLMQQNQGAAAEMAAMFNQQQAQAAPQGMPGPQLPPQAGM